jgi:2-oxoglutarate dehydrogenase E1 component
MVIGETSAAIQPEKVQRIVLCTGKVYWDLLEARDEQGNDRVALLRIEQLSPFPRLELKQELERYPNVTDCCWAQEEPRNQGAWHTVQHDIRSCMRPGQTLSYAGRYAMAAPAGGGSPRKHLENKKKLMQDALTPRNVEAECEDSPPPHEEAYTFLAK